MKIVFFGTPDYVLPILKLLNRTFKEGGKSPIVAVVTQKPKPVGRKKVLSYSPIDRWAHERKIPIFYDTDELVEKNIQADIGILPCFGQILEKRVLNYFPHGVLNVHPSLLPEFRGASPVISTIATGKTETGVTIIKLDEKVDHGPIVSQFREEVYPDDTTESLRARLFEKSAQVLATLIPAYIQGKITLKKQDDDKAVYTTTLKKSHAFIPSEYIDAAMQGLSVEDEWNIGFIKDYPQIANPDTLERFVRAMHPWPIAWTLIRLRQSEQTKRLKILKAHIEDKKLVLDLVQLEGKNPVSWKQFE